MKKLNWLFIILAAVLAYLPLLISVAANIHPTTSMVHEQLGINYVTYHALHTAYYFAETGQFSILHFSYPPSILIDVFFLNAAHFEKMQWFSWLFYTWHGTTLFLVILYLLAQKEINTASKLLILLVPFATNFIEHISHYGLLINYNKGTEFLFLLCAVTHAKWLSGTLPRHWLTFAWFGMLLGIALGIKMSLPFLLGPIIAVWMLDLLKQENFHLWFSKIAVTGSAFIATVFLGMLAFCRFNLTYLVNYAKDLAKLYTSGWFNQRTPFLFDEITSFFNLNSSYFGWQLLILLWIITALWVLLAGIQKKNKQCLLMLGVHCLGTGFLIYQLHKRLTQGTMIDTTCYLAFSIATLTVLVGKFRNHLYTWSCAVLISIVYISSAFLSEPLNKISKISEASAVARKFNHYIHSKPELPVVYYMTSLSQNFIFPSADLFILVRTATENSPYFRKALIPSLEIIDPNKELFSGPHIAIVPDCPQPPLATERTKQQWAGMPKPFDAKIEHPQLFEKLKSKSLQQTEFQFPALQPSDQLLYYFFYPFRVSVFVISP